MLEEDESTSHSSIEESVIFLSLSLCLYFSTSSSSSLAIADVNMLPIFHFSSISGALYLRFICLTFIYCLCFCFCPSFFLSQNFHQALLFVLFETLSHYIWFLPVTQYDFTFYNTFIYLLCSFSFYYLHPWCYFPSCFWNLSAPCSGYNLCVNYFLWHSLFSLTFFHPPSLFFQ